MSLDNVIVAQLIYETRAHEEHHNVTHVLKNDDNACHLATGFPE